MDCLLLTRIKKFYDAVVMGIERGIVGHEKFWKGAEFVTYL